MSPSACPRINHPSSRVSYREYTSFTSRTVLCAFVVWRYMTDVNCLFYYASTDAHSTVCKYLKHRTTVLYSSSTFRPFRENFGHPTGTGTTGIRTIPIGMCPGTGTYSRQAYPCLSMLIGVSPLSGAGRSEILWKTRRIDQVEAEFYFQIYYCALCIQVRVSGGT